MNKLWNWLKIAIEKRPVKFVMVGGALSYALGMTTLAATFLTVLEQDMELLYLGMAIGSSIPIAFHWFVARYERTSYFAQILALLPAVFLFAFVSMGAGMVGKTYQSCIEDPVTKEVRECRSELRMIWEVD
ncbi:hypothetical protein OA249_01150 [Litorivicinus sp.]|nr:hypothetical protein [Litorivicinus sp.]